MFLAVAFLLLLVLLLLLLLLAIALQSMIFCCDAFPWGWSP
jgi:hypothetical protein